MKDVLDVRYEDNLYFTISRQHLNQPCEADYKDVVIVMYLYYEDLLDQYLKYALDISNDIKVVIISSKKELLATAEKKLANRGNFDIILKDNKGRDVSAFLISAKKYFVDYKYLCFVHDKKSSYLQVNKEDVDRWAFSLVDNMISTDSFVKNVVHLLESRKDLGLLLPPEPLGDSYNLWVTNHWELDFDIEKELLDMLGLSIELSKDKPSFSLGTTFWCRTEALKKLVDWPWKYEDFPSEPMPVDGTISHAIERVLPYVAQDAGFKSGMLMTDDYSAWQFAFLQNRLQKMYWSFMRNRAFEQKRDSGVLFKTIEDLISYCEEKTKIYIYGAGVVGQRAKLVLNKLGIENICFLVSKKNDNSDALELEDYMTTYRKDGDGIVIAVTDAYKYEIVDLLKEKGIDDYYLYK